MRVATFDTKNTHVEERIDFKNVKHARNRAIANSQNGISKANKVMLMTVGRYESLFEVYKHGRLISYSFPIGFDVMP